MNWTWRDVAGLGLFPGAVQRGCNGECERGLNFARPRRMGCPSHALEQAAVVP